MKKNLIIILSVLLLLDILIFPIRSTPFNDDTRVYTSLTYRIVEWKKFTDSYNPYIKTKIYFIPNNYISSDTLWEKEMNSWDQIYGDTSFNAVITGEWGGDGDFLIKEENTPGDIGHTVLSNYDKPKVLKYGKEISYSDLKVGDKIKITYDGIILESYPGQLGKVYEIEILE